MEILSYIHAYTKYALPFNIAATGELGKQRLLEQSETFILFLSKFFLDFILFLFFLLVDLRSKATKCCLTVRSHVQQHGRSAWTHLLHVCFSLRIFFFLIFEDYHKKSSSFVKNV